jgi:hypothetical protein
MGFLDQYKQTSIFWRVILTLVSAIVAPSIAWATLYQPGATLEPDCPPTESGDTCGIVAMATAGANANITSLAGLTTALSAAQGGHGTFLLYGR